MRKNYPMTLAELISEAIKASRKYGADKYVLLSDDEEGNGYHECYFTFNEAEKFIGGRGGAMMPYDLNPKDCVILG